MEAPDRRGPQGLELRFCLHFAPLVSGNSEGADGGEGARCRGSRLTAPQPDLPKPYAG